MKFARAVKRRYGLAARRVAVRTHVAWYWRGLLMAAALGVGVALAWWMYEVGSRFPGFERGAAVQELELLREKLKLLEADNNRLQLAQVKTERHNQINSAAQRDTERILKTLQDENARLKEELAFFRGMMSGDQAAGVSVYRFKVERGMPGAYRYQLLLVQAGQREKVFQGRLQLVVTSQEGGNKRVLTFPVDTGSDDKFRINLKYYQNLEGSFQVMPNLMVKSVEARIFSEGSTQPKLTKIVNLS